MLKYDIDQLEFRINDMTLEELICEHVAIYNAIVILLMQEETLDPSLCCESVLDSYYKAFDEVNHCIASRIREQYGFFRDSETRMIRRKVCVAKLQALEAHARTNRGATGHDEANSQECGTASPKRTAREVDQRSAGDEVSL